MWGIVWFAIAAVIAFSLVQPAPVGGAGNGVSASPTLISPGGGAGSKTTASVITIDADEGAGDIRILAGGGRLLVDGGLTAVSCNGNACVGEAFAGVTDVTIPDAGNNLNTVHLTLEGPLAGPADISVTVLQGSSAKSALVRVRGAASQIQLRVLRAASGSATECTGQDAAVIAAGGAVPAGALTQAFLCVTASDSNGNRLGNLPVIFTTTRGSLSALTDMIGPLGQRATAAALTAGSETNGGSIASVSASVGGRKATVEVRFGGAPASCTISAAPARIAPGGSATVSVQVLDASGGPVADGVGVNLSQVNAGRGANVAVLGSPAATTNGTAGLTLLTAVGGPIALGASSGGTPSATCTGLIESTVAGPVSQPIVGVSPALQGTPPRSGTFGFVVLQRAASSHEVIAELTARGCSPQLLAVSLAGRWSVHVPGAPSSLNAGFPSLLGAGTPLLVRC